MRGPDAVPHRNHDTMRIPTVPILVMFSAACVSISPARPSTRHTLSPAECDAASAALHRVIPAYRAKDLPFAQAIASFQRHCDLAIEIDWPALAATEYPIRSRGRGRTRDHERP